MKTVKRFRALAAAVLAMATAGPAGVQAKDVSVPFDTYPEWPAEVTDTFRQMLVQEGGRVKPVHTYARFMLMQFSGRSKVTFESKDGQSHNAEAVAWLLDTLFRPQLSADLPIFVVDDSEAVSRIGVEPKEKRDRYSYNDLLPGRSKLAELTAEYARKKQQYDDSEKNPQYELDRIEGMVLVLGQNVSNFEYLMSQFGFARKGEALTHESVLPAELKELAKRLDMTEMLDKMPEMTVNQLVQAVQAPAAPDDDQAMLKSAMQLFFFHASSGRGFSIFPPPAKETEEWMSIGDVMLTGLEKKDMRPWAIERMNEVKALVEAGTKDGATFSAALKKFADDHHAEADGRGRGEGDRSEMEVKLYQGNYFTNSLAWFVLAFVLLAVSWLAPGSAFSKYLTWGVVGCLVIGLFYNVYGITLRCLIRHRPPITNLYDTVIFITGTGVLLALILERMTRIGVGLFVGTVAGVIGMFLSIKYEAKEATDTMGQLVAVLDTNFWLATHVTIINIGYAAGILSAILGAVYLVGRISGLRKGDRDFYRVLNRMNYGVICFCLFFSLVGTVLGGIWANYSWGRFWGWDPKENGALMICLWTLVILHGRMGGYLREIGINVNAVLLGVIVTFSWWGVNNLGVGLHSYGFTDGVWKWLLISWAICGAVMFCGLPLWLRERADRQEKQNAAPSGRKKPKPGGSAAQPA
ncbi:MAG: cytochrome c biogenesis protein CcsA [Verrucomicrobiales bacterium]|nr:cytochrome c biogenesis protein CcsA [Verrucomicrobiales bacterium]